MVDTEDAFPHERDSSALDIDDDIVKEAATQFAKLFLEQCLYQRRMEKKKEQNAIPEL